MNITGFKNPLQGGAPLWRRLDHPPVPVAESHSRFVHITEPGVQLRRHGFRLQVARESNIIREIPLEKLQGVYIYGGSIDVSTPCMLRLLKEGVWLTLLSARGEFVGRLQGKSCSASAIRLQQYTRTIRQPEHGLELARSFVRSKIESQIRVANGYAKNRAAESLGSGATMLRENLQKVLQATSLDSLRGIEGSATRAYFELFRRWHSPAAALRFETRQKRGAGDPVNMLLNLGYTMLTRELEGLLEGSGLDPALGFYHQFEPGRPSLACDWIEEFRHPLVDRLVLRIINRGLMTIRDFELQSDSGTSTTTTENRSRIAVTGLRKFLALYEKSVAGYRGVFLTQLELLLDAIQHGKPYQGHTAGPSFAADEPAAEGVGPCSL